MKELESRWALPDLQRTINWCARRNAQGIRSIIDILGEYARDELQATNSVETYLAAAKAIYDHGLNASLTVKVSALGALFNREGCRKNVQRIAQEAANLGVGFEIDMEGQGLVTYAIDVAAACVEEEYSVSLALQAYLDRTRDDLKRVSALGITARIVKGAYVGSIKDFAEIQQRFKELVSVLHARPTFFTVGTHDPEVLEWTKAQMGAKRDLIEFGFLKGLADRTKIAMAEDGWRVSEYVPFGEGLAAYEARRKKYLNELQNLGRISVP
jgi:proline dehydrogenase